MKIKFLNKNVLLSSLPYLLLIPFFYFLFRVQLQRVSAFGCFDDCLNYMGAYFMLKGKTLYSQIFFNHQMLMAYISFLVQKFLHPSTIYTLLVYHRIAGFLFATAMDVLLLWRYRKSMIGFVFMYELTKHYLFGDRFLAEAFIVYPFVYLLGIVWMYVKEEKIFTYDYVLSGLFVWFIIFSREPYVPLALLFFFAILFISNTRKEKIITLVSFIIPSIITLLTVPFSAYIFNVIYANLQTVAKNEFDSQGGFIQKILYTFGYPLVILFQRKQTIMGNILLALDGLFLFLSVYIFAKKNIRYTLGIIFILIILAFANIRYVIPGTMYYEAFHMIVWYGLFVASICFFLQTLFKDHRKLGIAGILILCGIIIYAIVAPDSYLHEKVDRQTEFVTNYGIDLANGSVIKILSKPTDNIFLDGMDDMIYWQADRTSQYQYSWYTSIMLDINKYKTARAEMLQNNPPDFYYGYCIEGKSASTVMPSYLAGRYQQLYFSNRPTCLYVNNKKIPQISIDQWNNIKDFGYYLPAK